jgi:formylglycine-generating enzyme required for sulfatase activity
MAVGAGGRGGAGAGGAGGAGGTAPPTPVKPATSCLGLAKTCGPAGDRDCCASTLIPGGSFDRDNASGQPATLSDFRLDDYEVSVGRFRKFVAEYTAPNAGAGKNPNDVADPGWNASWNTDGSLPTTAGLPGTLHCTNSSDPFQGSIDFATWTDSAGNNELRPINCLTWYVAAAFCIWDGARMPTDAELSYAAVGGDAQRPFPWGAAALDPTRASYLDETTNPDTCPGDGASACSVADFVPVGSKSAGNGRWGTADLAGNVSEWAWDRNDGITTPCDDCSQHSPDGPRVFRGGSVLNSTGVLNGLRRGSSAATTQSDAIGVRCARAP